MTTNHPAIKAGNVAVITGAASGIGLSAARWLGAAGMRIVLVDLPGKALEDALVSLAALNIDATAHGVDVGDRAELATVKSKADTLGPVSILMSNAGREGGGALFAQEEIWRKTIDTNLWGAIHCLQLFVPDMIASDQQAAVIVTGSKQGITLPPGDTAYNVSKAALRALTESLSHELVRRTGRRVTAHYLIPGYTFTGFTRAKGLTEKPQGAWSADQVVEKLADSMGRDDFYVLCPDNEVDRGTDLKRIRWGFNDIMENRPALSRWHPDYVHAFKDYMERDV